MMLCREGVFLHRGDVGHVEWGGWIVNVGFDALEGVGGVDGREGKGRGNLAGSDGDLLRGLRCM